VSKSRFPHVPYGAIRAASGPARNADCPCGAKRADGKPLKFKACCMAHGDSLAPPPGCKDVICWKAYHIKARNPQAPA